MFRRTLLAVVLLVAAVPLVAKDDWLPITKEDLALKDNPAQPGAPAMILHREVLTDNVNDFETNYTRIKIFTEEGKKYADVEMPYWKGILDIRDIRARTIQPDGTIVVFNGKPFEKLVVKSKWLKVQAKVITLPDVRAGSIIEYKYTYSFENQLIAPTWDLQDDLAIRHLKYVLHPYRERALRWSQMFLPKGVAAQEQKNHDIVLEMDNVPALDKEDFMPPERTLKARVEFFYTYMDKLPEPAQFWKDEGKDWYRIIEEYIGKRGAIAKEAAAVAPASDSPEVRLRKLYERAQQIRNVSYEEQKTEKEQNREKLKDNTNVEDVLKHGYGYRSQINRLFVALARAAGLDANVVRISERDVNFFRESMLDANQLDGEVALIKGVGTTDLFLDPATPFCPYGLLSWERTGVRGILPAKDGGVFITTTQPASRDAVTERKAEFRLTAEGDLEGKLALTFNGQEALQRRLQARTWDDTARRKDLESDIKDWMPRGATVTIDSMTGLQTGAEPLRVAATIKLPGFATVTGRRIMLPRGIFQGSIGQPFRNAKRVHPVYFSFPWSESDQITVTLPDDFKVENLPRPREQQLPFGTYRFTAEAQANTVKMVRNIAVEGLFYRVEYYQALKAFFDTMRAGEEEQVILRSGDTAVGK